MDRRVFVTGLALAALWAACRGQPPSSSPRPSAAARAEDEEPARAQAQRPGRAAPPVLVQGTAEAHGGGVAIVVQNRAPEPVELAASVDVERKDGAAFHAFPHAGLALRQAPAPAGCVRLAPGAELRPTPWPGAKSGAPPGTYRFVLRGCDGSYRVDGEPFEL